MNPPEKEDRNLDKRTEVLDWALQLEYLINVCLKSYLSIDPEKKTIALSNLATSISFKAKIDLLFDLGKIDKIQHNMFEKAMSIRNQFLHNIYCNTYCYVADHLDGLENWLIKNIEL